MIESLNIRNIEPKAEVKLKGKVAGEEQVLDPESMLEEADFANELAASLASDEINPKVKPVEVSAEQLMEAPSKFLNLPEGAQPDALNPKIFDPGLTRGVDKIIRPQTTVIPTDMMPTEMVEGEVDPELLQAILKTPQVQTGRTPGIDMAKSEVDPQLLNLEDFVAQKNMAMKKSMNNTSAYGMPHKGQAGKAGAEMGLKHTQTINELAASESGTGSAMNSQQFILNSQIDLGSNAQTNEVQAPVKTFNMSNIKSENSNQIMNQITDYIVQAKAAKEPTVNVRMNHEELGIIDITVHKPGLTNDAIAINIGTHSMDGKNFFQANSKDLFSHLTNSGLNVSDLKVETPSQTAKNNFDFESQSGRGGFGQDKQFGSEQNQKRHESERRQELWNLLKDKEAA